MQTLICHRASSVDIASWAPPRDKSVKLFSRASVPPTPEDRAAGRAHEMRVWATDDVFTALTSEARGRGWTLSRVIEALLIEVTKTRARVAELEKKR
jgi:hypothetical protein